ncbi:zeta toxin family protein [Burkholderia sp. 572]|uniref:zeta toxin family protein n=1 Tax=Burkholderia sp. 572 TaxID=3156414 RepID=UPI003398B69D
MDTIPDFVMQRAYARVEREAIDGSREQAEPKAILLGGQPGAGKTALARQAMSELSERGGAVLIDADRMRENLPQYSQLLREDPKHAADLTHADAGRWSARLTTAASEAHRNLVIDGTMRNPESLRNLARRLNERGYELEVRGVAMPAEVSLTRAQMRTEREIATTGVGRVVNPEQHDQAYAGMVETIALLEREKAVDRIQIVDRHHREVYRNELHQGEWREPEAAAASIMRERERPMTRDEIASHVQSLDGVLAARIARGAPAPEIADVAVRREHALLVQQGVAQGEIARSQGEDPGGIEPVRERQPLQAARQAAEAKVEVDVDEARAPRRRTVDHARDAERGRAFDTLGRDQALALFPELDAAYHHLETRTAISMVPHTEIERANLCEQIHRGQLPEGDVPDDVSRRAIGLAGDRHNLILRDAQQLERHYRGEVLANSTHHSLVKIGQTVGIVYPRDRLSRDVAVGEHVAIQYSPDSALHQVRERDHEAERADRSHDHQQALER